MTIVSLFGVGLMEWGIGALPLLIVGASLLIVFAMVLGAVPALAKRKRDSMEKRQDLSS